MCKTYVVVSTKWSTRSGTTVNDETYEQLLLRISLFFIYFESGLIRFALYMFSL